MLPLGKPKSVAAFRPHSTLQARCLHSWAASVANFIEPLIDSHVKDAKTLSFEDMVSQIRSKFSGIFENTSRIDLGSTRSLVQLLQSFSNKVSFLLSCIFSPQFDRIVCAGNFASLPTDFILRCLATLRHGIRTIELYHLDIDDRYVDALARSGAARTIEQILIESAALHDASIFMKFQQLSVLDIETGLIATKSYFTALGASSTISHLRIARLPGWRTSDLFQVILDPQAFSALTHLDIQVDDFVGQYVTFLFQKRSEESKRNFKHLTMIFPNDRPGSIEYEVMQMSKTFPHVTVTPTRPAFKESDKLSYIGLSMPHQRTPTTPDALLQLPDSVLNSFVSLDVSDSMSDINYDIHNEEDGDSAEAHRSTGGSLLEKLSAAVHLKHLRLLGTSWSRYQDPLSHLTTLESLEIQKGHFPEAAKLPATITDLSVASHRSIEAEKLDDFILNLSQSLPDLKSLRLRAGNEPLSSQQIARILALLPSNEYFTAEYSTSEGDQLVVDHQNLRCLEIISAWGDDPVYHPGSMPYLESYSGGPNSFDKFSSKKTPFLSSLKLSHEQRNQSIANLAAEFPGLREIAFPAPSSADLSALSNFKDLRKLTIESFNLQHNAEWLGVIPGLVEFHVVDPNLAVLAPCFKHKSLRVLNVRFSQGFKLDSLVKMQLDASTLPNLNQFTVESYKDVFAELTITGIGNLINIWIDNVMSYQATSTRSKVGVFSVTDCASLKICNLKHTISSATISNCPQLQFLSLCDQKKSKKVSVDAIPASCAQFGVPSNSKQPTRARGMGQIFGFNE